MGSLVISPVVSDITHQRPPMMVSGESCTHGASEPTSRSSEGRRRLSASTIQTTSIAAPPPSPSIQPRRTKDASSTNAPPGPPQPLIQQLPLSTSSDRDSQSRISRNVSQHSGGFDQSGVPLTNDPRVVSSSPSSPRLQPTYRSTRSLGGSEATSPSRIKVRDLSHIQSFASEEYLTNLPQPRPLGGGFIESSRQYEISSMPVSDIIEMVAGLLTKITTTNDKQHEHIHRPVLPPEEAANMSPQTSSVLAFHGKNVPSITILSYLSRIHKYCPTTYEVFLSLLVYFDRMTEMVNRGFLQSMCEQASSSDANTENHGPSPMPMNLDSTTAVVGQSTIATPPASGNLLPTDPQGAGPNPPSQELPPGQGDLSSFFVVDSYNIHRLVIAGVTCASKFFSDVFYTNSRYAKVSSSSMS